MRKMTNEAKKLKCSSTTVLAVAGVAALTAVGVFIIPSQLKAYSNKIYQKSLKKDDIDIDSLGPEIIHKDNISTKEQ